eukprot:scaffold20.g7898.t1
MSAGRERSSEEELDCSPSSSGTEASLPGLEEMFLRHRVQPKVDTLAGLAVRYNVSVSDIRRSNGLLSDTQMYARDALLIPRRALSIGPEYSTWVGMIVTHYGRLGGGDAEQLGPGGARAYASLAPPSTSIQQLRGYRSTEPSRSSTPQYESDGEDLHHLLAGASARARRRQQATAAAVGGGGWPAAREVELMARSSSGAGSAYAEDRLRRRGRAGDSTDGEAAAAEAAHGDVGALAAQPSPALASPSAAERLGAAAAGPRGRASPRAAPLLPVAQQPAASSGGGGSGSLTLGLGGGAAAAATQALRRASDWKDSLLERMKRVTSQPALLSTSPAVQTSSMRQNAVVGGSKAAMRGSSLRPTRAVFRAAAGPRRSGLDVRCDKVVGIDLGTTNSAVAAMEGGKPTIVPNAEGGRTTPSVVAYTKTGDRLVGQIAKRQAVVNPENTFFSVKRFIGRKMTEVKDESTQVPYRVVADPTGNVKIVSSNANKEFAPEEISAVVLRKLSEDAAKFLGDSVTKAVITVPAYFNDSQRQATKDAGKIGGLDVLRIINEPTAASLAYGLDKKSNETILVFDLGGGTFDVSVLEVGDGVFEVLSTSGDTHLGGDDFDKRIVDWLAEDFARAEGIDLRKDRQALQRIVDWLAEDFARAEGIDLRKDRQALQRLTEAAEKAKIELSSTTQSAISLPFITATADGPKHIDTSLTRAKFEQLCADLLERCRVPVETALRDAKLSYSDIDEVILVGGSTRIPAVVSLVEKLSSKKPNVTVNPDEVVALGAAVQGGVLAGEVEAKVSALKEVLPSEDAAKIKAAIEEVSKEVMSLGQAVYGQQQGGAAPGGDAPGAGAGGAAPGGAAPGGDDVIDAEFTEGQ